MITIIRPKKRTRHPQRTTDTDKGKARFSATSMKLRGRKKGTRNSLFADEQVPASSARIRLGRKQKQERSPFLPTLHKEKGRKELTVFSELRQAHSVSDMKKKKCYLSSPFKEGRGESARAPGGRRALLSPNGSPERGKKRLWLSLSRGGKKKEGPEILSTRKKEHHKFASLP